MKQPPAVGRSVACPLRPPSFVLSLSKDRHAHAQGFDKLSPNGVSEATSGGGRFIACPLRPPPFVPSLSKDRHARAQGFDKLSPNGVG